MVYVDVSEITQLVNSVGFPIVACGALFWMLNTSFKDLTDKIVQALDKVVQSLDKMNDRLDHLENAQNQLIA